MSVNLGNVVSGGIDVGSTVAALMQNYNQPQVLLQTQQTLLRGQQSALSTISTNLSDLLTKVDSLKDISGALNAKSTTTTNGALVTATASAGAQAGSHTVTVNSLASTGSYYSDQLSSSTKTFTGGDFTFKLAGASSPITIAAGTYGNTLDGLASAINNYTGGAGVTANVINDSGGSRLALVSNTSGTAGDINVTASPTGLGFTKATTGADASLKVDGIPVTSATNSVTQAIPGVTLNLVGADPKTSVAIGINADTSQAAAAIQAFVTSYNTVASAINAQNAPAAVLGGDSTIRELQQRILSDVSSSLTGNAGTVNLESIGYHGYQWPCTKDHAKWGSTEHRPVGLLFRHPGFVVIADINRDETQLSWVAKAIEELGGTISDQPEPDRGKAAKGAEHRVIEEDERDAQAFVDRWRPRVDAMQNARHAKMLKLILGEVLEQKRFFEQALAGRTDLLGRRGASLGPSHGEVLPSRWIE